MHAAAEVSPLGDGAGAAHAHQRRVVHAALVQGPVGRGLDGVRPELKHSRGDQPQQHHGEQGDVVDAVLGLHPGDERGAPGAVLPGHVHTSSPSDLLLKSRLRLGGRRIEPSLEG